MIDVADVIAQLAAEPTTGPGDAALYALREYQMHSDMTDAIIAAGKNADGLVGAPLVRAYREVTDAAALAAEDAMGVAAERAHATRVVAAEAAAAEARAEAAASRAVADAEAAAAEVAKAEAVAALAAKLAADEAARIAALVDAAVAKALAARGLP